jgi:hypothetical protein
VFVNAHIEEMNSFRDKLIQRRESLRRQRIEQLQAKSQAPGFLPYQAKEANAGIPGLDFAGDPDTAEDKEEEPPAEETVRICS